MSATLAVPTTSPNKLNYKRSRLFVSLTAEEAANSPASPTTPTFNHSSFSSLSPPSPTSTLCSQLSSASLSSSSTAHSSPKKSPSKSLKSQASNESISETHRRAMIKQTRQALVDQRLKAMFAKGGADPDALIRGKYPIFHKLRKLILAGEKIDEYCDWEIVLADSDDEDTWDNEGDWVITNTMVRNAAHMHQSISKSWDLIDLWLNDHTNILFTYSVKLRQGLSDIREIDRELRRATGDISRAEKTNDAYRVFMLREAKSILEVRKTQLGDVLEEMQEAAIQKRDAFRDHWMDFCLDVGDFLDFRNPVGITRDWDFADPFGIYVYFDVLNVRGKYF